MSSGNLVWHAHSVSATMRAEQKNQQPMLIWFTGLSGSGKSTLANGLEQWLFRQGYHSYLLDGDNIRQGLNKDLKFSNEDRVENIRRIGEVGKLMVDAGLITLSAFISPFMSDRLLVRKLFEPGRFAEIYVSTSLHVCESRDPKGLYKKARSGEIKNFTGLDSPYEAPLNPELIIDTETLSLNQAVETMVAFLSESGALKSHA